MEVRRSANYPSTIWNVDRIRSLPARSDCTAAAGLNHDHHKRLRKAVQRRLKDMAEPHHRLGLIDSVQRLGVAYQFDEEISDALCGLHSEKMEHAIKDSLYYTALYFRLLRQHGCKVSSDIFNKFKEEEGGFKASLCEDAMGLLSLYEAAHLGLKGEAILEEAKVFSRENLQVLMEGAESNLAKRIEHALELPMHWRLPRLEARHFIDAYEEEEGKIDDLLDFAKLDFNMVQMVHQTELKELSMWWDLLGLGRKMGFIRDRLAESFLLVVAMIFEPQYSECRKAITKATAFLAAIDDFYDVHGLPDELKIFTDVVNGWDLEGIDQLPEYMKLCYLAMYNTTNEMAYIILKEKGFNAIDYLKRLWAMQCNSYFLEAQWFNSGYIPKFDEYLKNARVSIGMPLLLRLSYTMIQERITKEELDCILQDLNLIQWPSIIFRLCDDLGTSKAEQERGDVPKSIQCYMQETGNSEEVARNHIRYLISDAWKRLNEECLKATTDLSKYFVRANSNVARVALLLYQHDSDGYGVSNHKTKAYMESLFFEPVPLKESINLG